MLILVFDTFVAFFLPCCVFICYKEVLASTSLSPGITLIPRAFCIYLCFSFSVYIFITVIITVPYLIVTFHLIHLSKDISKNPGQHFQNNFFNFMSWNLNSLANDNFHRVSLIEAHNSCFNYDLISICETSLNDSVKWPETLLDEYTFVPVNNTTNTRRGGVGLFYKNSLRLIIRNSLSFGESIVVEVKFGRKKICFTVFIEILPLTITLPISKLFCQILQIYIQISKQKIPLRHFLQEILMPILSIGGLVAKQEFKSQVICEPTNFEPNEKPSCIDLVITDEPNGS